MKEQSKQRIAKLKPTPKTVNTRFHRRWKVIATGFWDSHGIVFIDYLEKGKTGVHYAFLLAKLAAEIVTFKEEESAVLMSKIHKLQFDSYDHLPYIHQIWPSVIFFLFSKLKVSLRGLRFLIERGSNRIHNRLLLRSKTLTTIWKG